MEVTVFSAHKFEKKALEKAAAEYGVTLNLLPVLLNADTVALAKGAKVISVFVNDDVSTEIVVKLHEFGVKAILLRSAGFNHVDLIKLKNWECLWQMCLSTHLMLLQNMLLR